jgi:hypothetical protein
MMNRIFWGLVDISSRMLNPEEREVVCGDLAESGEKGSRALRDVLGLVVRRQAALWTDWRPWLTLVGLVVPLGMLLSIVSKSTADGSAVYIWMYANNLDWDLIRNSGFRYEFAHCIPIVFLPYLMLACWSWTCGFVLGSVSRGLIRLNSVLFCLMLLFGALLGAPRYFEYYWPYLHRAFPFPALPVQNDPVFALTFYRVMLPLIVQAFLVVIPSISGMRQGTEAARFRPSLRVALWTVAFAAIATMVIQDRFWLFPSQHLQAAIQRASQTYLLNVIPYWPAGYLMTNAVRRRRSLRTAVA